MQTPMSVEDFWVLRLEMSDKLVHVLDVIVYPDLPEWLVVGVAVVVCVAILDVYLTRYLRRRLYGVW
jgi:hypothetical protein